MIAASLKPEAPLCHAASLSDFRDQMIAASLKLPIRPDATCMFGDFRDQMIAASLKHRSFRCSAEHDLTFPRSNDRGLIEAEHPAARPPF